MLFADNLQELKKHRPDFVDILQHHNLHVSSSPIKLMEAKNGEPTLVVEKDGVLSFIHSKYDPVKEALGIVDKIDEAEVAKYNHVFFYGIGLGYLAEAFLKRFPEIFFTLYEPNPIIFCHHLSCKRLDRFPFRRIKYLYVDVDASCPRRFAQQFFHTGTMYDKTMFITLPSYERIFAQECKNFSEHFVYSIKSSVQNQATALNFQQLWTTNSMNNFKENLNNSTIFSYADKFKGKPAILAAAGPSLKPELDNLRRIREEGTAYIFTVGSANKLLVNNDIHPHVVACMEPQAANTIVLQEIVDKKIDDIVLLYGTSTGHKSVATFTGPKMFMMMDKDHVTSFFVPSQSRDTVKMVNDAPTIAITTLQTMIMLGCNPIILAGQNLAFLDNQYYADGIKYAEHLMNGIRVENFDHEMVESVDGRQVASMHAWIMAKEIMETFIQNAPDVNVINATKQGAKIAGAPFMPLEEVMVKFLCDRIVDEDWYKPCHKHFTREYLTKQREKMDNALEQLNQRFEKVALISARLKKIAPFNKPKQIEKELCVFEKTMNEISHNDFFSRFIGPMLMIGSTILQNNTTKIRAETDYSKKAQYVLEEFGRFVREAKFALKRTTLPLYKQMMQDISDYISKMDGSETDGK